MLSSTTVTSDAELSHQGRNQAGPSDVQPQSRRRNQRARKPKDQYAPHSDGTMSDGALVQPTASPRTRKPPRQKQPTPLTNSMQSHSQHETVHKSNAHRRPASVGDALIPATPSKEQAYAGPTFSASPAPSSLPVPKFLSRSASQGSSQALPPKAPTFGKDSIKPLTPISPGLEASSPVQSVQSPQNRPAMPLDLLFEADRNERQRNRSSSNTFSPEMALRSLHMDTGSQSPTHNAKKSFQHEVNGQDNNSSQERFDQFHNSAPGSGPSPEVQHTALNGNHEADERQLRTQSLKDLLFNTASPSKPSSPALYKPHNSNITPLTPDSAAHPPFHRSVSGPSTPAATPDQRDPHSFHYGNRNLSPLFKAARAETPPRPSALRQEMGTPNSRGMITPADSFPTASSPVHPHADSSQWARNYLDQQIKSSPSSKIPQMPYQNRGPQGVSLPQENYALNAGFAGKPQHFGRNASNENAHPAKSYDVQTMENDLRRMLRLNNF